MNYNSNNEVLSFFIYMWNAFSFNEAMIIWDGETDNPYDLAHYMWNKYIDFVQEYGNDAAIAKFVASLDEDNYNKLVQRACTLYNGRSNR